MKKRYLAAVIGMAGVLLLSVTGCGGSGSGSKNEFYDEAPAAAASEAMDVAMPQEAMEMETGGGDYDAGTVSSENKIDPLVQNGRKLIRTVRLEMQTKEFDTLMEGLRTKIQDMGGYIENSAIWGNRYDSYGTRSSEYTVRIPADRLDEFIDAASGLGNVTYKSESVEDVTLQYVDVESRQTALETEQERLLDLMEKAENLEDLLTIENRLSEVRYELENFGSQKRLLDNQIDYSTVYLTISEVERIVEVGEKTFFQEIADRFGNNLYNVGSGLREFVIVVIGGLPVLAVWAAVIAVFVLVIRKLFYGKKREKKEKSAKDRPVWWKKKSKDEGPKDEGPEDI